MNTPDFGVVSAPVGRMHHPVGVGFEEEPFWAEGLEATQNVGTSEDGLAGESLPFWRNIRVVQLSQSFPVGITLTASSAKLDDVVALGNRFRPERASEAQSW